MGYGPVVGKKQAPITPYKGSLAKNNPCTICGKPGIPGIIRGAGKCQYHWAAGVWGKAYADSLYGRQ